MRARCTLLRRGRGWSLRLVVRGLLFIRLLLSKDTIEGIELMRSK